MEAAMTTVLDGEDAAPQGDADGRSMPERSCIVTRQALEKDQLIRFVLGPDNAIVPDLSENLPGRGYWVTASRKVLAEAVKKNAFAKAMRAPVRPDPDLVDRVAGLIDRQVVDLLGLARRSGSLVTGFEKVDVALRTGKAVLLIEAKDAGADGRAKLARHTLPGVEIWSPLTAEQLGRAIGRDHAVHVAVAPGGLANRLKMVLRRQQGLSDDGVAGAGHASAQPRTE
ncbi:RNA-binding protein [Dongia sp. agr-C8]